MSINVNKFVPRPGLVNKQGCLPDPSELVCIEVPKVYDQCLIKRCLVYGKGPDTITTDCELRSNPLDSPRRYIDSTDFKVRLLSLEKISIKDKPDHKKIILDYVITFCANYIDCDGVNKRELYEINRTDIIGKFYCPDSISQISGNQVEINNTKNEDTNIIKLEMVADDLEGKIVEDCDGKDVLDITLGYFLVVKCQLIVQILIPAYDYIPDLEEPSEEEPEEDPCEVFDNSPVPDFHPAQDLEPLFPESDDYSHTNKKKYIDKVKK
ncbi:MAG: hypothetical protein ACTHW2_09235 [Tissierella sp.]|uniref:hypothetical protein n=1 Tax=Tissierella sp. TaxID=41274 RepID=UPI003F951A9B